jgi:hypothetical protein
MNENTGQTVADGSGKGNTLTLGTTTATEAVDPTWVGTNTCEGSALQFDGVDDVATVQGSTSLNNLSRFTISFKIYPTAYGENGFGRVLSRETNAVDDDLVIVLRSTDSSIAVCVPNTTGQVFCSVASVDSVPLNTLTQWVVSYDDSGDKKLHIYKKSDGTFTEVTYSRQDTLTGNIQTTSNAWRIGNRFDGARTFQGVIDTVRVWNYVLSAEERDSLASECTPAWVENLNKQTIVTDAYCRLASSLQSNGPVYGNNKIYIAYMDNSGGGTGDTCGGDDGAHKIFVKMYNYTTGQWSTSPALSTSVDPSCCDAHDAPSIFRDNSGFLYVFYAPITAGGMPGSCFDYLAGTQPRSNSPFYRKSLNPDDISAWGAEQRVPLCTGFSEPKGGFDSNGVLHLFGQKQFNNIPSDYGLTYIRMNPDGTWSDWRRLINDGNTDPLDGQNVGPGCVFDVFVEGTTIHLIWGSTTNGCSGSGNDIYYAKSTDGGNTWTNIDGTASFTFTQTLSAIALNEYPAPYKVLDGFIYTLLRQSIRTLNGVPIIAVWAGDTLKFIKYSGTGSGMNAWTKVNVDTIVGGYKEVWMGVTSTNKIVMYATDLSNVYEYTSTDGGNTWTKTTIHYAGGGEASNRNPTATLVKPPGRAERVLLEWMQEWNPNSTRPTHHTEILFWDRIQ